MVGRSIGLTLSSAPADSTPDERTGGPCLMASHLGHFHEPSGGATLPGHPPRRITSSPGGVGRRQQQEPGQAGPGHPLRQQAS